MIDGFESVDALDDFINGCGIKVVHSLDRDVTGYYPKQDRVLLPAKERFHDVEGYYSVALHELTHATGHDSRLARPGITDPDATFGSPKYALEELVAQLGSAFLCGHFGIQNIGCLPRLAGQCEAECSAYDMIGDNDDDHRLYRRAACEGDGVAVLFALNQGDMIEQRGQRHAVIHVGAGEKNRQRCPSTICQKVSFGARPPPIHRVWADGRSPFLADRVALSIQARDQSRRSAPCSCCKRV
ncbi:DNA primase TraC [Halomonas elongata]|uniref:DNA primase TraC n=1 Tax=Halomonas elongata TaxID=2746 RepID=A0A1B8NYA3_HALEL|nr:DNA primase TraC [Halomonas elongata]